MHLQSIASNLRVIYFLSFSLANFLLFRYVILCLTPLFKYEFVDTDWQKTHMRPKNVIDYEVDFLLTFWETAKLTFYQLFLNFS